MTDWLTSYTSLPNLHPALVHFPVALVPAAWLFELAAAAGSRHRAWLARAATGLWLLAALGAGAAYWAGRRAADSLVDVPPGVQAYISTHSDWGLYTLWSLGLLAALRLGLAWWDRETRRRGPSLAFALLGLGATGLVLNTADLGGGLVYRHGVAVAGGAGAPAGPAGAAAEGAPPPAAGSDPAERLHRAADGTLTWRPLPGDRAALGSVLEVMWGPEEAVRWVEPAPDAAAGLVLEAEGRALLALPGRFGDVQVEAEIVPEGFAGTLGVAHHARGAGEAGLFTVELPTGEFALRTARGEGRERVLDRATRRLPDGPLALAVSSAGRHLRGTLGGELVVHGHEPALPEGRVGLLVEGSGRLRLLSMKATPIRH